MKTFRFLTLSACWIILMLILGGCNTLGVASKPTATSTPKPTIQPTPSTQEIEAWGKINCMDMQSMQAFVDTFPSGVYANETKLIISLFQKTEAIKASQLVPDFTISFEQLGEQWQFWKEWSPEKGGLGMVRDGNSIGIFSPIPGCPITTKSDSRRLPLMPTGDGSIFALDTSGYPLIFFEGITMESYDQEVLYFAVIDGKGLVHIYGRGKVTMPDGSEIELK